MHEFYVAHVLNGCTCYACNKSIVMYGSLGMGLEELVYLTEDVVPYPRCFSP